MSNEEILQKAIEKAVKNGWVSEHTGEPRNPQDLRVDVRKDYFRHIYDIGFAKAFWGEELVSEVGTLCMNGNMASYEIELKEWQYHLQQMVVSDDPIAYLADFLD